jgi:hypothetical protein
MRFRIETLMGALILVSCAGSSEEEALEKIVRTNALWVGLPTVEATERPISLNGYTVTYDEHGRMSSLNGQIVFYDMEGKVISMNGNPVTYDQEGRVISFNGYPVLYEKITTKK